MWRDFASERGQGATTNEKLMYSMLQKASLELKIVIITVYGKANEAACVI
jgi:hypothetical protein